MTKSFQTKTKRIFSIITTLALIMQVVLPGVLFNFDIQKAKAAAGVTITSPSTTDIWTIGNSYTITWTHGDVLDYFKLYYSGDYGANWTEIDSNVIASSSPQSYGWQVPVVSGAGEDDFRIKVDGYLNVDPNSPAESSEGTDTQITTDSNNQTVPAIYGDRIVWDDGRNDLGDIYMYDITTDTETRITTDGNAQYHPAIYGDRIVWDDDRNVHQDIYMYDISTDTETRITTDGNDQQYPAIYGDRIVWQDYRNSNWDIYMYDISTSTETRITTDGNNQILPVIYGDRIVWDDDRNSNWDIYMYDISTSTETRITTDGNNQRHPAIYGDRIVWHDNRNDPGDIYMYDISTSTETRITTDSNAQGNPAISGDRIVWNGNRNDAGDIYMYDISTSTETRITTDSNYQVLPTIYSDRIVWQDNRNTGYDIYMRDLQAFTIKDPGGGPDPDPETIPPESKVIGILEDGTITSPLPDAMHQPKFTVIAEADDASGIKQVELFWSQESVGAYQSYGTGIVTPLSGIDYWTWDFDTESLGGNGRYYFYSQAIDNSATPNTEIIPKDWWSAVAQYDDSTLVSVIHPKIVITSPINEDINVGIDTEIRVIFDCSMDTTSVESAFSVVKTTGGGADLEWTTRWYSNNKTVRFRPIFGQLLDYDTNYTAHIDPNIARNEYGISLDAKSNVLPNPWTFQTAIQQTPDLTTSTKIVDKDFAEAGNTLLYTITLKNSHDSVTANVTFRDTIPNNTIYDDSYRVRNAVYDPDNNQIIWDGTLRPNRTRIIRFRVIIISSLPNKTMIKNEAIFDDGTNPSISKFAETVVQSPEAHIVMTSPIHGDDGISTTPNIKVVFDQPMDRALTEKAFSVIKKGSVKPEGQQIPWKEDFGYRKRIVIDKTQVSGSLTDFPVLVSGTNPSFRQTDSGGNVAQSDGGDIMFTLGDGTTKLSHELEQYNPYTGTVAAWVRMSSLSNNDDTEIYMYYGKSDASDQWDTAGTWDSNYAMVQHMADNSTSTTLDSTSNNNDGRKRAVNNPMEASGKIGMGQSFARSGYINCGNDTGLMPDNITVEGWAKANTLHNWMGIISNMRSWGTGFSLQLGDAQRIANMVSGAYLRTSWYPSTDTWYHVAATHNSITKENILYVNGVRENSVTRSVTYDRSKNDETHIGVFYTRNSLNFDGIIDEIRVSSIARSADWITTQFNNQNSPSTFYTMWGEEALVDADITWLASWDDGDKTVTFAPAGNRHLNYLTEYEAEIDRDIAKTKKGSPLAAGDVVNPWVFETAKEQVPDLTASTKDARNTAEPGDTIIYTIRLENNGDKTAETTFVDNIPFNTIYDDNSVSNATWDPDNNRIVWNGDIEPNHFRIITFGVIIVSPLPNNTTITNEAVINDGVNPEIIKPTYTIVSSPEAHIVMTSPINGADGISTTPNIKVVFDQPMDRALTEKAFSVIKKGSVKPEGQQIPWKEDFGYRKRIVIDKTQVSGSLTNFPVLVSGTNPSFRQTDSGGNVAQSDGGDIMFTLGDGTTKLSHELEQYNPYTGTVAAWVRMSSLSNNDDTEIYMYYGKSDAENQWDTAGTWDSNYQMVQHMADNSTSTTLDSTSNNNDGRKRAVNNPMEAPGKIGSGQSFARSGYINCGNDAGLKSDNITIEGWVKANTLHNWMGIISNMRSWGTGFSLQLGDAQRIANMVSGAYLRTSWYPSTDTWYHVAATHNSTTNENILYVNGVRENSSIRPVTYVGGAETHIGVFYTRNSLNFDGIIDEIRVSNTVRSADWITTQFNNQNSPSTFYTMWGEEALVDADITWLANWDDGDKTVTFTPAGNRHLNYLTEYEAEVDRDIAKTKKGSPLVAGDVVNPWVFETAKEQVPDLTASTKDARNTAEPGDTITYTIRLENNGDKTAETTFVDNIPFNTIYDDNSVSNATWDPDNNRIVWNGDIEPNHFRIITFGVIIVSPLPNNTTITNEAVINDGVNPEIIKPTYTIVSSPEAHIVITSPRHGDDGISTTPNIKVVFDQPMDRALTEKAFSVIKKGSVKPEGQQIPWKEDFGYRKRIVIDKTQVSGSLTNFPVLVSGTNPSFRQTDSGGNVAQSDGGDIMFTLGDGTTKLSHELEQYNPYTGTVAAWVRMSSLSNNDDTEIYMYYGKSDAENQWDTAGTWDSNYQMVQHMADNSTSTTLDSTSNNNDGVKRAVNNPMEASGKIGMGQSFARSGYINCGNDTGLTPDNITVEGWVKANALHNWMGIISNMRSWGTGFSLQLGDAQRIANMVSGAYLRTSWYPSTDTWYHVAATHNSTTNENILYVNGVRENSSIRPVTYVGGAETHIGVFYTRNSLNFDGIIDEIRVSNIARSADWITTQFNNQNSPSTFYTMWGEEALVDADITWLASWDDGDKTVVFLAASNRSLNYLTEYEAEIDRDIAKTKKGSPLVAGDVVNPWVFVTAFDVPIDGPNLVNSTKDVDENYADPGDILIYTIDIINSGKANANVTFIDYIPTNTTYAFYVSGGARYDSTLDAILWEGIVPVDSSHTIQFQVKIDESLDNGTNILNEAIIIEGVNGPISRSAQTIIMPKVDWDTSYKEDINDNPDRQPHTAYPGDILNYTVFAENAGVTEAINVSIVDLIPWRTTYIDESATGGLIYEKDKNQMAWSGNISPNENKLFTFKVLIDELASLFTPPDDIVINEAVITDLDGNFATQSTATVILDEGGGPNPTDPYLIDVSPAVDETSVKLYTPITLTFSEPIMPESLSYIVSINDNKIDTTTWTTDSKISSIINIYPDAALRSGTSYTIQITDVIDTQGQHLSETGPIENNTWSFTTVRPAIYFENSSILNLKAGTVSDLIRVRLGDWINYNDPNATAPIYAPYQVEDNDGILVKLWSTSQTGRFDKVINGAFSNNSIEILMPCEQDTIIFYYTDSVVTSPVIYKMVAYAPYTDYLVYAGFRSVITTADGGMPNQNQIYFITDTQSVPVDNLSNPIGFEIRNSEGRIVPMEAGDTFLLTTNSTTGEFFNQFKLPLDQYAIYQTGGGTKLYYKLSVPEDALETTMYYRDSTPGPYLITVDEDYGINISGVAIAADTTQPANGAEQDINIVPIEDQDIDPDPDEDLEPVEDESDRKLAYVTINPKDTTLLPGAVRSFEAHGYDTDGKVIENLIFGWYVIAGGGSINKIDTTSAVFRAGNLPGLYENTVMVAAFYNGEIKSDIATVRILDMVEYGGPDQLPSTGPNGIQWLFICLILISAVALALVEHYEKTHFEKV